tara:strand:+ start:762 stop:1913 length:1152 start_codon:yes stop_codon:yes gene_type:complete
MNNSTNKNYYHTRIISSLKEIGLSSWNSLISSQKDANPFLSFAFLNALHDSGSACLQTGWDPKFITVWEHENLMAAIPLYIKYHSYGEYVFDWAWADAYQRNNIQYYPKLLSAIPFSPVTGSRIMFKDEISLKIIIEKLFEIQEKNKLSSTHVLYLPEIQAKKLKKYNYMIREGVQFQWKNNNYETFDHFLASLEYKKRKKIRAERRKVKEAGFLFTQKTGSSIKEEDWIFFKKCYDNTYFNHYSQPYLNLDFFLSIGEKMQQNTLLIFAEYQGKKIAASLLIYSSDVLYGRYWGCISEHPLVHFETSYYQAIEFCISKKISQFEGGAQGEHKLARGFLPKKTFSAHLIAHEKFSNAVDIFLKKEKKGINYYLSELNDKNPFR